MVSELRLLCCGEAYFLKRIYYSYYDELYETSLVKYSSLFKNCLVILAHGIKWNGLFYLKKSMVTKNFVLDSSQK